MFFNKEGYPYNFQYDDFEQKWEGKILFDENSSELFKTIGIYVFEKVDPLNFSSTFDFEPSQLFNTSGITFISETYKNENITNIEKVNSDASFYTKWIYGKDFDIKFRKGTVITISGQSHGWLWDDFIDNNLTYFTVLSTKKDAILISTKTDNLSFTGFTFVTGSTITSHNIIRVNDYGNQQLVDFNNLNYYNGKKLNIVNSELNDGIYTYDNYSIVRTSIFDFDLSNETTGKIDIDFTLYTERPKIYTGYVDIYISDMSTSGTTIIFHNDINNDIDFSGTGQTIIFEKYNGDSVFGVNPIFTITGYKDRTFITEDSLNFISDDINDRYYIELSNSGTTGLTFADSIYLEANPVLSGKTIHNQREFDIANIDIVNDKTRIEVEQYVSTESGHTYKIYKNIKKSEIQTVYASQSTYISTTGYTGYANCFSTTNKINITQDILLSGNTEHYYENTIDSINVRYGQYLKSYGIELFHYNYSGKSYLIVDGIFDYNYNPYFDVSVSINGTPLQIGYNFTYVSGSTWCDTYIFEVYEKLNNETVRLYEDTKLSKPFEADIEFNLNNDLLDYGFKLTVNSASYFINYYDGTGTTTDTEETIDQFIIKYGGIFDKLGFTLSRTSNKLTILAKYSNIDVVDIDVFVNIYSTYSIDIKTPNKGIVISSNQLRSIYTNLYDLELSTGMIISVNGSNYSLNNKDYNIIRVSNNIIQLSYQGPFFYDYNVIADISTREFIRKPRSYYNKTIDYEFSWVPQQTGEINEDIFFYDYSGDQLEPYNGISGLTYTGVKPLYDDTSDKKVFLNRQPNKFDDQVNNPSSQQTVFDDLTFRLETLDDSDSYDYTPQPFEIFIGYNSPEEGVDTNEMVMKKIEYSIFSGVTTNIGPSNNESHFILSGRTIVYLTNDFLFDFTNYGFESDQLISIDFIDVSETGQTLFTNYNTYRIKDITPTKIFIDSDYSGHMTYFNTKELFEQSGKTFTFVIKTEPKELLRCKIYGQTEIEDERIDINLRNLGIDVFKEAEFIFKESDIKEQSVDYKRLNRKRKEMLSIYTEIFNYVGSYKALIHAIDYFGYNDLQLYEYYRNIKQGSPLYRKLQKLLIPDIFDNTVDGWNSIDYIQNKYDKGYYKKTNLFNLTYRITDIYGNYSLQYSLDEVQIKLVALVKWLRKNVIPLSSNIRDITGVADVMTDINLSHDTSNWISKSVIDQDVVGVNFNYTSTRINGDDFLVTINFYTLSGTTEPEYFTVRIKTFSIDIDTSELIPQQNFKLMKTDYKSYSFTVNENVDPYISIETTSYNGYGVGHSNSKMFRFNEIRNFYLVNTNFNATSYPYLLSKDGYYIVDDGRYYIVKY